MKIFFKKVFVFLSRIAISFLLLLFLFRNIDKKALFDLIKSVDIRLLCVSGSIFFITHILGFFRWEMLLRAANIRLPLKRVVMSFAGGIFFNLFLPSTIGGDLVRSIDLAAHTKKTKEVVATVFLDRLSGFAGLVLLSVIAVTFGWEFVQDKVVLLSVGIVVALLFMVLFVLFNDAIYLKANKLLQPMAISKEYSRYRVLFDKIRQSLRNLHQEIHIFKKNKKVMAANLLMSFMIQIVAVVSFYFIGVALGLRISIIYYGVFLPLIGAITFLPISLGGLGLRDATTVYFFAKAGVSKYMALAMSLLNFSFVLICGSIGGIIYVLTVHHRRIQRNPPPSVP